MSPFPKSLVSVMPNKFPVCLLISFLCIMFGSVQAQTEGLRLQKSPAGFYVEHKVLPKQGLFSIGRQYLVHPHALANFNRLDHNKGLQIDQVIRVPLSDTNFERKVGEGIPVFLSASADDEISDLASFVGTDPALIQCWNRFDGTVATKGSRLIIGFLKTGEPSDRRVKLSCPDKPTQPPQPIQPSLSFYEQAYLDQIQRNPVSRYSTVATSFFTSERGWKDGRFYVLLNGVNPGTIVKLINPENKKEVYAKVLGEMPRIKQNVGLDLRINEAALDVLVPSKRDRFSVELTY